MAAGITALLLDHPRTHVELSARGRATHSGRGDGSRRRRERLAGRRHTAWPQGMLTSLQLLQELPGLLEISSFKTLGEPCIDFSQQVPGLVLLALLLPQPTDTYGYP